MSNRSQTEREIGRAFRELGRALRNNEHPELANAFRDAGEELDPNRATCDHAQLDTVYESTGMFRSKGMQVEYTQCVRCGLRRYSNEMEI